MKAIKHILIFLLIIIYIDVVGQKQVNDFAAIDKKALQIPDSSTLSSKQIANYINANFKTEDEKARAIFIWVATNIEYDVENMYAINFYEKVEDKISKSLKTKKGICENYANLFNDIALQTGLQSYVLSGYTKQDSEVSNISHAWCASMIDSVWFLFDPTWGSGYINNSKFVKKINNNYYKVLPSILIKSHIPFDMIWQFLNYPVTNQEFYEGKTQENKTKMFFNYKDSIIIFNSQSEIERLAGTISRIEKNGIKNSLIYDNIYHLKSNLAYKKSSENNDNYNFAVQDYNLGNKILTSFINYRINQLLMQMQDEEIQKMITDSQFKYSSAKSYLDNIKEPDQDLKNLIISLNESLTDQIKILNNQKRFSTLYLSKGKFGRKLLLINYNASGIP